MDRVPRCFLLQRITVGKGCEKPWGSLGIGGGKGGHREETYPHRRGLLKLSTAYPKAVPRDSHRVVPCLPLRKRVSSQVLDASMIPGFPGVQRFLLKAYPGTGAAR